MAISRTYLIISFFVNLIPYVSSVTFDLKRIGPQSANLEIVTEGTTAYISKDGIQLTPDSGSFLPSVSGKVGRATYIRPLHLWDRKSGDLASFFTDFSFVIGSNSRVTTGGGLTFFLAQNNSVITSGRKAMGLPVNLTSMKAISPFVSVKFVTPGDYSQDHVGISINSLDSVVFQKWSRFIPHGGLCTGRITYDSISKNLTVSYTGFQNYSTVGYDDLVYTVDLRNELPEWVILGFSAASGFLINQIHTVKSWCFRSTDLPADGKNSKVGLIVVVWAVVIFVVVILIVVLRRWKLKKMCDEDEEEHGFYVAMNNDFEIGTGPKRFSYHKLARSTGNFAENEKLGEGGFGSVYKGFLKDCNTYVAVKKVSRRSKQGIKEYASELKIISRLRHRNLVQLVGWCHENRELLLVYEFMENGSLDLHLFKEKTLLTWDTRYKIALGLSSALMYLHEEWEQCVLHRDIKSSNVMLDSNFNPKLGDFGLAKLVEHEKCSKTTVLAGTWGYMAPECVVTGKVSKESDVFSFGVVALEIASGRRTVVYNSEDSQVRLVEWVWELYGTRTILEAVDPRLGSDFDVEEMKRLMIVGLWCAHPDPEQRPSMRQLIQVLKFESSIPNLPSEMPVATYLATHTSLFYGLTTMVRNQLSKLGKDSRSKESDS
ncbi:hypothetical protein M8C21_003884 [Ambrosia artemisiifolia]|uniref:Protein kinase domain-containing protein n=1 Tax=Ambrosia artemisiifolia TaxID=4212 RepID=A0AAD5GEI9_AMBAR|nr:hypothetical protein M8C21_003884 [Ambrosia artemisiifolia]